MTEEIKYPWQIKPLDKWALCGMNHYYVGGERLLYVSMVNDRMQCIKAEGKDSNGIWARLSEMARHSDKMAEIAKREIK